MKRKIQLTQGKYAIIDDADFLLVSKYKWYYRSSGRTNGKNGYAQTSIYNKEKYKKLKGKSYNYNDSLFMHNLIIKPKKKLIIDHIDRNGLNNTRENLRLVTKTQNYANFPKKGKNKYRGVQKKPNLKLNPYEVVLKAKGKVVYNKTFKTEKEAAIAYNKEAIKWHGKCAQLNKI